MTYSEECDLYQSILANDQVMFYIGIVLPIPAIIAVALRFNAARLQRTGYKVDDWLIFVALVEAQAVHNALRGHESDYGIVVHNQRLYPNRLLRTALGGFSTKPLYMRGGDSTR